MNLVGCDPAAEKLPCRFDGILRRIVLLIFQQQFTQGDRFRISPVLRETEYSDAAVVVRQRQYRNVILLDIFAFQSTNECGIILLKPVQMRNHPADIGFTCKAVVGFCNLMELSAEFIIRRTDTVPVQRAGVQFHQSGVHTIHGVIRAHGLLAGGEDAVAPFFDFLYAIADPASGFSHTIAKGINHVIY